MPQLAKRLNFQSRALQFKVRLLHANVLPGAILVACRTQQCDLSSGHSFHGTWPVPPVYLETGSTSDAWMVEYCPSREIVPYMRRSEA